MRIPTIGDQDAPYLCTNRHCLECCAAQPVAAVGLVSRVTPVHTAMRNCTRDEGRPFGFGNQVADPKPPQAAVVKSDGGERCGNVGAMIPAGKIERGERKQTASEASKSD